jgi:gliding motility-associated-like protein
MNKFISILATILIFTIQADAQEISIAAVNDYSACEGAVVDSGLSAGDYGANENETITWCPVAPETVLNLYWVVFDLDAASTITIYDGDDNTAPLVGIYTGTELQGQDIFSGVANVTGCMTVEFVSGAGSSGNFGAYASCGYPCDRPFAIVNPNEAQPLLACLGEDVYLESTSSTVADGQEIVSWVWDLGDGTSDNTSGAIVTHSYTEPGLYVMNLSLTDDNDCENNNVLDYQILVSTNPDFSGTSTDITMCVGDQVDITGMVEGVLYNAEPSVDFGGGLFIPDDQSGCFSSELTFSSFYPGAVVNDANADILSAFINFEHSYMGDLTITFICPNGASILVHQQGGNGTFLGVPIDNDADLDPGVGWDYFWEPLATNGTWEANAGGTLPSGAYESFQPFTNLNGCPLNGTWEIEVCDLWGSDNGFIFDWSLQFAPELYPEAISFTPTFGPECDSTWWDGPSIILGNDPASGDDCNTVIISPQNTGIETYSFRAINDFGCLYDQTLDVTVVGVTPTITASPLQFCGSEVVLTTNLNGVDADNCSFSWNPAGFLDNSTSQNPTITYLDITTDFTITVEYDVPSSGGLTCINEASIRIETCEIKIPNVFTPNGDGENDMWRVDGLGAFNNSKVSIFNRWGALMYSNIDFGNAYGWSPSEDEASEGVYYYVLEIQRGDNELIVTDDNGTEIEYPGEGMTPFTGSFMLLRD